MKSSSRAPGVSTTTRIVIIVVILVVIVLYFSVSSLSSLSKSRSDEDQSKNSNNNKKQQHHDDQGNDDQNQLRHDEDKLREQQEHAARQKARMEQLRLRREKKMQEIHEKVERERHQNHNHHKDHHDHNNENDHDNENHENHETTTAVVHHDHNNNNHQEEQEEPQHFTDEQTTATTTSTRAPVTTAKRIALPVFDTTNSTPSLTSKTFDRDINRQRQLDIRAKSIEKYRPTTLKPAEEVVPGTVARSWLKDIETGKIHDEHMDEKALDEKMADVDIVYTWVNGSEMVHRWKKSQVVGKLVNEANSRDRDSDELRHSMRSIFKYLKWHKGRITVVSNGHVPNWMDLSNPRMRVVHQDAIALDEQERFTFNTNGIEQNLWRIPTLSHYFIQFNDDYFVMRDCPASTFFNEHGGPVLLYENGVVNGGMKQVKKMVKDGGKVWVAGVFHTHALIHSLLSKEKRGFWKYIKHAPFTYCKSYLQSLQTRAFPGVYHRAARHNRFRNHLDVLTPFIHHAFSFSNPDVLLSNRSLRKAQKDALERAHTDEDKTDLQRLFFPLFEKDFREDREGDLPSCAPVTWKTGHAADSRLVVLKDDTNYNKDAVSDAVRGGYQFITLNDGFGNGNLIGKQLFDIVDGWFPNKSHFEINGGYELTNTEFKKLRKFGQHNDNNNNNKAGSSSSSQTKDDEKEKEKAPTKSSSKSRDKHQELKTLHKSLNTGKYGIVIFASTCDGICSSIRSCDLGFSRLQQRLAPPEKQPKTTTATTTVTTTEEAHPHGAGGGDDDDLVANTTTHKPSKKRFANKPSSGLSTDVVDALGETTFYIVPTYYHHEHESSKDKEHNHDDKEHEDQLTQNLKNLRKQLSHCHCPIGSFQHIDSEEYDTVPRIFSLRNDTVHVETDINYFAKATKTNFATAFHAEKQYRLEVRDHEILKKVVYRARDEHNNKHHFPSSLPLMVLTTVDPVFGEAVSAGHVADSVEYDERDEEKEDASSAISAPVGVIHFAPLPTSVHPRNRELQRKSDVLLLPEHARLSYLRTYPIPSSRNYEIPLKKFLKFFLMSYRTGTLGFNPNFVRKREQPQKHEDHNHQENPHAKTEIMKIHAPTVPTTIPTTTEEPAAEGHHGDA